jgi:hypothetical protein
MQHLGHEKVLPALAGRYFWPTMKTDVRKWLDNCAWCENAKATRNEARGMLSARLLSGPPIPLLHGFSRAGQSR